MKKLIITTAIVLGSIVISQAQPDKGNPDVNPAPLDGGVSLLLAAGAALGGKKAYDAYKSKGKVD